MKILQDKKILVIGSNGLIGQAIVTALIDLGAKLVCCDLSNEVIFSPKQANKADLSRFEYRKLDITSEEEIQILFKEHNDFNGIVNLAYPRNASYGDDFLKVTFNSYTENISSNLGGSFNLLKYASKSFINNPRELSIINFSSIYGVIAPKFEIYENTQITMPVEYAAIKAGVQHMSKYCIKYIKDSRFRINCICPGGVSSDQPENFKEEYSKHTLGHGMIDAEDLTGSVVYLLSDLSRFVNGQQIIVDDGFCI